MPSPSDSESFLLGKLTGEVINLTKMNQAIWNELKTLRGSLDELKFFRAKVVGFSIAASIVSSAVFSLMVALWAK